MHRVPVVVTYGHRFTRSSNTLRNAFRTIVVSRYLPVSCDAPTTRFLNPSWKLEGYWKVQVGSSCFILY